MREKTRNLLVGLTVIIALVLLGAMITLFQELPEFVQVGYRIQARFPNASGAGEGSDVLLAGRRIGRVTRVEFTDGDARKGVTFTLLIDRGVNIPGDVNAYVRSRGLTGGVYVDLVPDPASPRLDPMPHNRVFVLEGKSPQGSELGQQIRQVLNEVMPTGLGADIRDTLASVKTLAETMNSFLTPPMASTAPQATSAPTQPARPNLYRTLAKLDEALEAVNKTLGDRENQDNLRAGLANFKVAAAAAGDTLKDAKDLFGKAKITFRDISDATRSASGQFQTLTDKLIGDADELSKTLTLLQRSAAKIDAGEGSAARFVNDPALYENLVEAASQMKETLNSLQNLLDQWRRDGVRVRWR
ncbi:MAG: hypothetical protein AMJ81_10805 [Phycisphaerae bacterium SM23_33]|nr:MAG: hypothetical protein AMJ81_10805 [Phycisphaerae bacterium SM23_33]